MISSYTISSDLNVISVIFVDLSIEGLRMLLMIVPFSSVCVFSYNSANKPATEIKIAVLSMMHKNMSCL